MNVALKHLYANWKIIIWTDKKLKREYAVVMMRGTEWGRAETHTRYTHTHTHKHGKRASDTIWQKHSIAKLHKLTQKCENGWLCVTCYYLNGHNTRCYRFTTFTITTILYIVTSRRQCCGVCVVKCPYTHDTPEKNDDRRRQSERETVQNSD